MKTRLMNNAGRVDRLGICEHESFTVLRTVNASQSLEDHTDRQRIVETRVS
jgi:hypothetical protein